MVGCRGWWHGAKRAFELASEAEQDKEAELGFRQFQLNNAIFHRNQTEPGTIDYFNAQNNVNFWSGRVTESTEDLKILAESQDNAEQEYLATLTQLQSDYAHNMDLKAKLVFLQGSEEGVIYFDVEPTEE